jgi:hypothetical protein
VTSALHFDDAAIGTEIALPVESDVCRPTQRREAKTKPAYGKSGRTELEVVHYGFNSVEMPCSELPIDRATLSLAR